jgi:hypothetical protein
MLFGHYRRVAGGLPSIAAVHKGRAIVHMVEEERLAVAVVMGLHHRQAQ